MIKWPSISFPPVNLYSCPRDYPPEYKTLEREFTQDLCQQFEKAPAGTLCKRYLRLDILDKQQEFNKLWNSRYRD